ncbi:hypothetical protein GCM10010172_01630 [Paractinoplanes ferrugineus]|uniref:NlpC/P60 domain-containing protein n=1 Tax=Paractinoplanes ferrugineus TaxID=113564 RepID=A0A919MIU0_9ACTN|nr:C40 family peptidase [Actinoplanes ferrugineus]GIE14010.1 hypothetical protein Afe05nite_58500 [Actinoplanes ferrugineus]
MFSAAAAAAIAALFNPLPAVAAPPSVPQVPAAPAVPDAGSRPMALGTLLMPGQVASTPTVTPTLIGSATSPVLQQIEKGRAEIATMGDDLIKLGQDRDLAQTQFKTTEQRYDDAAANLQDARTAAADAAAKALREAAAMPPGAYVPGLAGLDDLARIQRGDASTEQATTRQIESAETAVQLALDEETLAKKHWDDLVAQYTKTNTTLNQKQAAQQTLELAHVDELSAAETSETAADSALGAQYLTGAEAGRGADARAVKAVEFALSQRGKPYEWSEEGPNTYDCSGLMWASYRTVGFQLQRVSRDQYWQTRNKVVDRYSLLPGDLLFFSYSNSWRGIHHVAMYAGNGMMVEAPRTGLNVRLTPVRWSRLFQATRVFGSVPGVTEGPVLGAPDPDPADSATGGPKPPTTPAGSSKPTTPTTPAKPTTSPTGGTKPTTSPTPSGSTPATPPTTTPPTTTPPVTTTSPQPAETSAPPTGGTSSGGTSSGGTSSGGTSSGSESKPASSSTSSRASATKETSSSSAAQSASSSSASASSD